MFSHDPQVFRVLCITFVMNLLVCLAKLLYGIMTHSLSLEADGFHSLLDASSNVVGLAGVFMASKPPDEGHPYGHRKIEALASLGISFLLFITCLEITSSVIQRIQHPIQPQVNALSFIIMAVTICINFWVSSYEKKEGMRLNSDILLADAAHTRSDILVSFSVMASFVAVLLHISYLDWIIASAIVVFIFFVALRILSNSISILLDAQLLDPKMIATVVQNIPGIVRFHKIRSRGTRNGIFVDLHIHVDPLLTTESAHMLTHQVISAIKAEFPQVVDVLIHTEPAYSTSAVPPK